jgi:hypothetical protein
MKKKKPAIIVPVLLEPNGKVERFLEVARNPKVRKEYNELLKELKCKPSELGRKIRELTWKGKSVDEIYEELA